MTFLAASGAAVCSSGGAGITFTTTYPNARVAVIAMPQSIRNPRHDEDDIPAELLIADRPRERIA
jgi:hypothetical protein